MKEDFLGLKNVKDPLDLDWKETGKNVVVGIVTLAIGIPLIEALIGGTN